MDVVVHVLALGLLRTFFAFLRQRRRSEIIVLSKKGWCATDIAQYTAFGNESIAKEQVVWVVLLREVFSPRSSAAKVEREDRKLCRSAASTTKRYRAVKKRGGGGWRMKEVKPPPAFCLNHRSTLHNMWRKREGASEWRTRLLQRRRGGSRRDGLLCLILARAA